MIRTQVQLSEAQLEALRRLATEQGISIAALIRKAVDRELASGTARERFTRSIGGFHSRHRDISADHDRYLAEDLGG